MKLYTIYFTDDKKLESEHAYKIGLISKFTSRLEEFGIINKLKKQQIILNPMDTIIEFFDKMKEHDISVYPGFYVYNTTFANRTPKYDPKQKILNVQWLLAPKKEIETFVNQYKIKDDVLQGKMLGYQDCCIDFFNKYYIHDNLDDLTINQQLNTKDVIFQPHNTKHLFIPITKSHAYLNHIYNSVGLKWIEYMPHSFDCKKSIQRQKKYEKIQNENGFSIQQNWLNDFLSMPYIYQVIDGVGYVKNELFNLAIESNTELNGYILEFLPMQDIKQKLKLLNDEEQSKLYYEKINEFKVPIDKENTFIPNDPNFELESIYKDNGFYSLESMNEFHNQLIEKQVPILNKYDQNQILDLGAGNCELLFRLQDRIDKQSLFGIEINENYVSNQIQRMDKYNLNLYNDDLYQQPKLYDGYNFTLTLFSILRLVDTNVDNTQRENLLKFILSQSENIIFYTYNNAEYEQAEGFKILKKFLGDKFNENNIQKTSKEEVLVYIYNKENN